MEIFSDEYFMKKAIDLARQAFDEEEIPVGAILVSENKIIGKGYNQTEKLCDVTAHAEMLALTAASSYLNSKFLSECTLYVTLEPCLMCAGALKWARVSRIVYAADEPKFGYTKTAPDLFKKEISIEKGIMASESGLLLKSFFAARR